MFQFTLKDSCYFNALLYITLWKSFHFVKSFNMCVERNGGRKDWEKITIKVIKKKLTMGFSSFFQSVVF